MPGRRKSVVARGYTERQRTQEIKMNTYDGLKIYASLLTGSPEKQPDVDIIAAWLEEYAAAKRGYGQDSKLGKADGSYDPRVAPGQIRILSGVPCAVLEAWDTELWLVAPFSPYKAPATPGEMTTGMPQRGRGVIQVWNCRTVPGDYVVQKGLLVDGVLPEETRADARALFRHELFGTTLPKSFKATRGAPVTLSADPRREYIANETRRADPLTAATMAYIEGYEEE